MDSSLVWTWPDTWPSINDGRNDWTNIQVLAYIHTMLIRRHQCNVTSDNWKGSLAWTWPDKWPSINALQWWNKWLHQHSVFSSYIYNGIVVRRKKGQELRMSLAPCKCWPMLEQMTLPLIILHSTSSHMLALLMQLSLKFFQTMINVCFREGEN